MPDNRRISFTHSFSRPSLYAAANGRETNQTGASVHHSEDQGHGKNALVLPVTVNGMLNEARESRGTQPVSAIEDIAALPALDMGHFYILKFSDGSPRAIPHHLS